MKPNRTTTRVMNPLTSTHNGKYRLGLDPIPRIPLIPFMLPIPAMLANIMPRKSRLAVMAMTPNTFTHNGVLVVEGRTDLSLSIFLICRKTTFFMAISFGFLAALWPHSHVRRVECDHKSLQVLLNTRCTKHPSCCWCCAGDGYPGRLSYVSASPLLSRPGETP